MSGTRTVVRSVAGRRPRAARTRRRRGRATSPVGSVGRAASRTPVHTTLLIKKVPGEWAAAFRVMAALHGHRYADELVSLLMTHPGVRAYVRPAPRNLQAGRNRRGRNAKA